MRRDTAQHLGGVVCSEDRCKVGEGRAAGAGEGRAGVVRLACSTRYLQYGCQRLRGCAMRALVRREGDGSAEMGSVGVDSVGWTVETSEHDHVLGENAGPTPQRGPRRCGSRRWLGCLVANQQRKCGSATP